MAFYLSPGVYVKEWDLSTIVPAVGTTEGAFVGNFAWGPVNQIVTISNEKDLVSLFGKPDTNTFESFFTAANFLSYARNLKVARAANLNVVKNAATGKPVVIRNEDEYTNSFFDLSKGSQYGMFAAKYPGVLGNSLMVSVCATGPGFASWAYKSLFDGKPGTSDYVDQQNGINDEMHVVVVDRGGLFTGVKGTVLEKYAYLSKASDAREQGGGSNYYVNVINDRSRYIYVLGHQMTSNVSMSFVVNAGGSGYANGEYVIFSGGSGTGANAAIITNGNNIVRIDVASSGTGYKLTDNVSVDFSAAGGSDANISLVLTNATQTSNWGKLANPADDGIANGTIFSQSAAVYTANLSGGVSGTIRDLDIIAAYDMFADADSVDVSLVMTGGYSSNVVNHVIDNVVLKRLDCVAFVSPPRSAVVDNNGNEVTSIQDFRENTINKSTSYAFLDSGWKKQYDKYNNVYRWVPLNGDIAGLCVRTDFERDPWYSPAGFNRGAIKNVTKLSWNPDLTERDEIYKIGVNPVVSFAGEGTILYGDKTMLSKPSAFDRINVRRLFIVLEKAIARAAKYSMFEFNDEFTRAQFVALIEPYLRDIQGRRGIYDFRVVCDETNNTPEVIDRNEFVGDIYIKPARSINFIQLNFVAVRTGVAFEEVVGSFN